jgi:superkiller protein 3
VLVQARPVSVGTRRYAPTVPSSSLSSLLPLVGAVEDAYKCFIAALKRAPTFAPAFTALGVYYAEHAAPPDPARASKCFQKAFELDPREADAARRLAEGFADEREWDLVDVVARRTIEGEGGAEPTSRYLPMNAWAWKAVGAVELVGVLSSCRFIC